MRILLVDNYDSFTYNISQIIGSLGHEIIVVRNNLVTKKFIKKLTPDRIIISPGPGSPDQSVNSLAVVKDFHSVLPILGICLGHQIIARFLGCRVIKGPKPMHGKKIQISNDGKVIYKYLPAKLDVGLYNSLIVENKNLPDELVITALSEDNLIMGIRHKHFPLESVQFHPDSILTPHGKIMLKNWVEHEY